MDAPTATDLDARHAAVQDGPVKYRVTWRSGRRRWRAAGAAPPGAVKIFPCRPRRSKKWSATTLTSYIYTVAARCATKLRSGPHVGRASSSGQQIRGIGAVARPGGPSFPKKLFVAGYKSPPAATAPHRSAWLLLALQHSTNAARESYARDAVEVEKGAANSQL